MDDDRRDPLTGEPLPEWKTVVTGPDFTGPRRTIVNNRPGAELPAWIVRIDIPIDEYTTITQFLDTGAPGGLYQPDDAQQLPDLTAVVSPFPWGTIVVGVVIVAALLAPAQPARRRRRR